VLFGADYLPAGSILRFSSLFIVFNLLLQINFQILSGTGQVKKRLRILGFGLIANLILTLLLIHGGNIGSFYWSGTEGVSFAVGAAWVVIFWLSYRETRSFAVDINVRELFKNGGLVAILSILFWQILPSIAAFTRLEK
jgi:O-antigen/teichoic acid export membrane protein